MQPQVKNFIQEELKKGLIQCTEQQQQHFFKRMYSHDDLDRNINEVVDNMEEEKLDHVLRQVETTLINQKLQEVK